jgi:DNA-binding NarL/FixJ family response regulator
LEQYVEAVLFDACGESTKAVCTFSAAYNVLARLGYRRRATMVALRLARLTGKKRCVEYAGTPLRDVSEQFWMARELRELLPSSTPSVTETELAILRLLVRGKTYKEIGALRRSSWKTVANHVQALFRKFGVNSRGELAAEAMRRRLVTFHGTSGAR